MTSLDAPIVATLWYCLFSVNYQCSPSWEISWLLFSTVWVVYALDRIFESESELTRERHHFHQNHFTPFIGLITCVVIINCGLVWLLPLPIEIYKGGIILGAASVAYIFQPRFLLSATIREWIKNVLVTVVFSSGCILPVWVKLHHSTSTPFAFWLDIGSLLLLALTSLRAVENTETSRKTTYPWDIWMPSFILLIAMGVNPSPLKWTWLISALLTACLVPLSSKHKLPTGIFDLALILPTSLSLLIIR